MKVGSGEGLNVGVLLGIGDGVIEGSGLSVAVTASTIVGVIVSEVEQPVIIIRTNIEIMIKRFIGSSPFYPQDDYKAQ